MITGSASLSAARARLRSPVAIASSTLRTKLRNFERRLLLISVRRAILRVALRAEVVLAMRVLGFAGGRSPVHPGSIGQKPPDTMKCDRRRGPHRQLGGAYRDIAAERQRPCSRHGRALYTAG